MKWGIWMSPIWGALNKKLALFMNGYNAPLKHHRCRMCSYKDQQEYSTELCWKNMREAQFSSFMDVTLFHRFPTIISMAKVSTLQLPDESQVCPQKTLLSFPRSWLSLCSASQPLLNTEEVHSWGAIVFLLKILIKHHLFISVSIPNVDIFKFFLPVNTCKLCGRVISGE